MSQHTVAFHISSYTQHVTDGYVSRGSPATISLDTDLVVTDNTQRHKGIHIYTNDSDINVLVINDLSDFGSVGDYIAIPYKTYSTEEYIYYAVSSSSKFSFLQSLALLVGTADNTSITITPTVSITIPQDPQDIGSSQITIAPGTEYTIILHRLQTLMLGASNFADITGTKIVSNKPVTVISGHECGNIPANRGFCEHLTVQIPSTVTWGQTFILNTYIHQGYRVIASKFNTTILVTCLEYRESFISNVGHHTQFSTNSACYINSSEPILVIQFGLGIGNPVLSIITPILQYISDASFYTPSHSLSGHHYVSITAVQQGMLLVDGDAYNATWNGVYDNVNSIGYTTYFNISSRNSSHTIRAECNKDISITAFGLYDDKFYLYSVIQLDCGDGMYVFQGKCVKCITEEDDPACFISKLITPIGYT